MFLRDEKQVVRTKPAMKYSVCYGPAIFLSVCLFCLKSLFSLLCRVGWKTSSSKLSVEMKNKTVKKRRTVWPKSHTIKQNIYRDEKPSCREPKNCLPSFLFLLKSNLSNEEKSSANNRPPAWKNVRCQVLKTFIFPAGMVAHNVKCMKRWAFRSTFLSNRYNVN